MQAVDYFSSSQPPASGTGVVLKRATSILIVEDERIIALDLRSTLSELGYRITGIATSAAEVHVLVRGERPDLVLMDVRLSGDVDGIEVAALLRAESNIPVVFLTANADKETLRRALKTTPGGFLAKPFNQQGLVSAIEVALSQHEVELGLRNENLDLRRESMLDSLTGLHNRRYLDGLLARELEFAARDHHPVGVVLLDLDYFKAVNDQLGHAAGDAVLRGVADALRARARVYDTVCRYGGEEMVVVVPGASLAGTRKLAEDLREGISRCSFSDGYSAVNITASFGVATFPDAADNAADLLRAADAAMYRAKALGRNCVVAQGE